jgi:hypothetical protein
MIEIELVDGTPHVVCQLEINLLCVGLQPDPILQLRFTHHTVFAANIRI